MQDMLSLCLLNHLLFVVFLYIYISWIQTHAHSMQLYKAHKSEDTLESC